MSKFALPATVDRYSYVAVNVVSQEGMIPVSMNCVPLDSRYCTR